MKGMNVQYLSTHSTPSNFISLHFSITPQPTLHNDDGNNDDEYNNNNNNNNKGISNFH